MYLDSVLETIGNTPLVKLQQLEGIPATVLAKVEAYNPGLSAKDRIVRYMIAKAEQAGKIRPGATIIEATSGNTGYSLALNCAIKGYKCLLTITDKASEEKIQGLKALGAEVIVCPSKVAPEDPRSYYSQAKSARSNIANSYYLNQNFNTDNMEAHYLTTGPEIWEQTSQKITHYVCCAGTGGTISGSGRFLKEQDPDIKVVAVDGHGSVLKKFHETGIYDRGVIKPIRIEGLGKTIIPANVDFSVIDEFARVTDKDAALRVREIAKEEGLFVGYSSGAALQAVYQMKDQLKPTDVVVILLADHGSRYLSKIFNDLWMREQGFLPELELEVSETVQNGLPMVTQNGSYRRYYRDYYKRYRRIIKKRYRVIKDSLQQKT
ncbi:MAG: cysteine synthase family protein [Saprospiraceae bacterium]|nr:cysteine synthase family protein [Saprospiraceae bacterium]